MVRWQLRGNSRPLRATAEHLIYPNQQQQSGCNNSFIACHPHQSRTFSLSLSHSLVLVLKPLLVLPQKFVALTLVWYWWSVCCSPVIRTLRNRSSRLKRTWRMALSTTLHPHLLAYHYYRPPPKVIRQIVQVWFVVLIYCPNTRRVFSANNLARQGCANRCNLISFLSRRLNSQSECECVRFTLIYN